MKRKYTKRNCSYWGHDVRFLRVAIDQTTEKIVAYYGICKRCNKRVLMPTNGRLDNAALRHLVDVTLEDLPKPKLGSVNYEFMDMYKK